MLRLERSQSFRTFDTVLTRAPYLAGERRLDRALSAARVVFENARENVPKVMLLFMAGKQVQVSGNAILTAVQIADGTVLVEKSILKCSYLFFCRCQFAARCSQAASTTRSYYFHFSRWV